MADAPERDYWTHCPACACPQLAGTAEIGARLTLACCGARCVVVSAVRYGVGLELAPTDERRTEG